MKKVISETLKKKFEEIAKKTLFIETLETKNCGLDFKEVAVWSVEAALLAAYQLGKEEVNTRIQGKIETFDPDERDLRTLQTNMTQVYGLVTLNK